MNKKMWGLLLSVVFADSLKSSMGSSLGSVPPDMLQKMKGKKHGKSLILFFWWIDIEEVEEFIGA